MKYRHATRMTDKQKNYISQLKDKFNQIYLYYRNVNMVEDFNAILDKVNFRKVNFFPMTTSDGTEVINAYLDAIDMLRGYWLINKNMRKNINKNVGNITFVLCLDLKITSTPSGCNWWHKHVCNSLKKYFSEVSEEDFINMIHNTSVPYNGYVMPIFQVDDIAKRSDALEFQIVNKINNTYKFRFIRNIKKNNV